MWTSGIRYSAGTGTLRFGWGCLVGAWTCSRRSKAVRLRLKCDGTRAETRFRFWAKRTNPFKPAGASVQSPTGRRAVHISLQGLYCSCKPVFCSHVTLAGYPLHSLVSPSLLLPWVTACHHISTGLHLRLVPRWRIRGTLPPFPYYPTHCFERCIVTQQSCQPQKTVNFLSTFQNMCRLINRL
jgi:hypothetical protein